jgi:hypothetical protein
MKKRTKLAIGTGAALAVVGAGGALAADRLSPATESKAVVEDAAKELGVTPAELTDALKQALENRIDAAVESGRLTQERADAMKERLESGAFPLFPGRGFGHHGHGHGPALDAAAAYLGLDEAELRDALRAGTTLAGIARDEGKSVDGLVDALVAAATERLDQAVEDGKLTQERRDELVAGLEERLTAVVNAARPAFRGHRGFGEMPPAA